MAERMDVFISSTSHDLAPYREAVVKVVLSLGMYPIDMATFNPTSRNALQLCYEKVQEAEIFVGVYAYRYGYAPGPDVTYTLSDGMTKAGDGETSITHQEYLWALERNLPMLLFVISDTDANNQPLAWPTIHVENEPGKSRLENFKNLIMGKHVVGFFLSPDNLASQVATGLLGEILKRPTERVHDISATTMGPRVVGERISDVSSNFRDRNSQRNEIGQFLADPATKVISVIGRGGIGKTALVSKVLSELEKGIWSHSDERKNVDGIAYLSTRTKGISLERIFLDCADFLDDEQHKQVIATWTNAHLNTNEKISRLIEQLKEGFYILLLDNMEDLLDEYHKIKDADLRSFFEISLRTPHNSCLLITTREPLAFSKEVMRFDRRITIEDGLPEDDAVEVLKDLDPHGEYGLRDTNEGLLRQLVRKVHSVPRALEVVASILANDPFMSIEDLVTQDVILNHDKFVEELVSENYKRLNADSRYVVEALAVYGRPVPMAAVEFLLNPFTQSIPIQEILTHLIQIHTVTFDRRTKLVTLHPIDQDYVYLQIPKEGEYNHKFLEKCAAGYYAQLRKPRENWLTIADIEPQLLEFEHLVTAEEYDVAAQVIQLIDFDHLIVWGYSQRVLDMRKKLIGKTQLYWSIRNVGHYGYAHHTLGNYHEALECYQQVLPLSRETGDRGYEELCLDAFGYSYQALGEYTRAIRYHQEALAVSQDIQDRYGEARIRGNLGTAYRSLGEHNIALEYYAEALKIIGAIGKVAKREENRWLGETGVIYCDQGEYTTALSYLEKALDSAIEIRHGRRAPLHLGNLGKVYVNMNDLGEGIKLLQQSIEDCKKVGALAIEHEMNCNLCQAYLEAGNLQEALECIAYVLRYNIPFNNHKALVLHGLVLLLLDQRKNAQTRFEEALKCTREMLNIESKNFTARYSHALSLCGLALLSDEKQSSYVGQAKVEYGVALENYAGAGIVEEARRLLNRIQLADNKGILSSVRAILG